MIPIGSCIFTEHISYHNRIKCRSLVPPVVISIQTGNVLHSCQNVVKGLKTDEQTSYL